MDQQHNEAVMSDAATKVGDAVGDLAARSGKVVQDRIDQAKPVLRDLQESAGAVMDAPPTWLKKPRALECWR